MKNRCIGKALIILVFIAGLYTAWNIRETEPAYGEGVASDASAETEAESKAGVTQMAAQQAYRNDLSEAFRVILEGATKEFIAGYVIDESFLMWLDAVYGDEKIIELASRVLDSETDVDTWYEVLGSSIHVLWLEYCGSTGFQNYLLNDVYRKECASGEETVISFAGDFNFADGWCTTEYMEKQPNGIYDCFSENLLDAMNASDILLMNNEFTYTDYTVPLAGKDYTFRAEPGAAELLSVFGTDAVTLANNHVFDFGEIGLSDTMKCLAQNEIPYLGAGENREEASRILYFVANGRKIAFVSATEIERSKKYTREATETQSGVLKTLDVNKFLPVIEQAKEISDYVVAVVHWGTEGTLYPDSSQKRLAQQIVGAGADAIIGGHPHRLQGASFVNGAPVAYSIGNFWFSDGTLYTTLAQIVISADGELQLRYLPCIQEELRTRLITDAAEQEDFYHYLASISQDVGIDARGNVYDKSAPDYPEGQILYDSDTSTTGISGYTDNEGNAIDIVGNLRR